MFKLLIFACLMVFAAAKPGVVLSSYAPVAYSAPLTYSAYTAPLTYSAYTAPVAAYSAYTYASPYSYYLRR